MIKATVTATAKTTMDTMMMFSFWFSEPQQRPAPDRWCPGPSRRGVESEEEFPAPAELKASNKSQKNKFEKINL